MSENEQYSIDTLERDLGYRFNKRELLEKALVHKSFANEKFGDPGASNERLEFLGDAVLDLVVAQHLFMQFPELPEGELSRIRSELVSAPALARLARSLSLGRYLCLGRGEEQTGGREKDNLLADAMEAVWGAVFLDSGWERVRLIIVAFIDDQVVNTLQRESHDYKTRLQEEMQAEFGTTPEYILKSQSGPDHNRLYQVCVYCNDEEIGCGSGRSKKAAQQQAAQMALDHLESKHENAS